MRAYAKTEVNFSGSAIASDIENCIGGMPKQNAAIPINTAMREKSKNGEVG